VYYCQPSLENIAVIVVKIFNRSAGYAEKFMPCYRLYFLQLIEHNTPDTTRVGLHKSGSDAAFLA
jgi:hypothetical protein